jgi:transcriptional regulator with XRE-family HTH domain
MNDPLPSRETRAEIRERLAGNLSVINHHIGHRLKMRRKVLRLSQGALGGFVGVSFQQIQKYEHGSNRMCAALLYQLGTVLHAYLFSHGSRRCGIGGFFGADADRLAARSPETDHGSYLVDRERPIKHNNINDLMLIYILPPGTVSSS